MCALKVSPFISTLNIWFGDVYNSFSLLSFMSTHLSHKSIRKSVTRSWDWYTTLKKNKNTNTTNSPFSLHHFTHCNGNCCEAVWRPIGSCSVYLQKSCYRCHFHNCYYCCWCWCCSHPGFQTHLQNRKKITAFFKWLLTRTFPKYWQMSQVPLLLLWIKILMQKMIQVHCQHVFFFLRQTKCPSHSN